MTSKATENSLEELVDDCVVYITGFLEVWEVPVLQEVNKRIFRTLKKHGVDIPLILDKSSRPFGDVLLRLEFDENWRDVRGLKWDAYKKMMAYCGFAGYMTKMTQKGKSAGEQERMERAYRRCLYDVYLQLEMLDITRSEFHRMIGFADDLHGHGIVLRYGNDRTIEFYTIADVE